MMESDNWRYEHIQTVALLLLSVHFDLGDVLFSCHLGLSVCNKRLFLVVT